MYSKKMGGLFILKSDAAQQYFIRKDHANNIQNPSFIKFLRDKGIPFENIKSEILKAFELAVNEGKITNGELTAFLDRQTRHGYNRTIFCKDIEKESLGLLRSMSVEEIVKLIESKGWKIPKHNNLLNIYLPDTLTLAEFNIVHSEYINLTFIETIKVLVNKNTTVDKENNYYFVSIDLLKGSFYVRMRPRGNAVTGIDPEYKKVPDVQFFYKITSECQKMLNLSFIDSTHFKTTLYKIAKELTEKAEEKWRLEVQKNKDIIKTFSDELKSKLEGFDPKEFDLEFRIHRLLERSLIQSNFKQLKQKEPGKKGFIIAFHFTDKSGGKIKASSREKERAIDLSEIYYDTRDTIDKRRTYDNLWVNWFVPEKKVSLSTRLEANNEFYQIHFYTYLNKDDLDYVLSEIDYFKRKQIDE